MADDARDGKSASSALSSVFAEISQLRTREATDITPSGFVVVTSASFWMDIFIRHFLCAEGSDQHDDLVFFVKKTACKASRRYVPRLETTVQVFRRNSKKLPIADLDLHWEETVYLNLIVQQLEYTLTAAACLRTGNQHLQVLRRRSQRVYASPTRHSMEDKGDTEEVAYPDIFFAVDNYEEAFQGLNLRPGELLCVELCARCRDSPQAALLFLGAGARHRWRSGGQWPYPHRSGPAVRGAEVRSPAWCRRQTQDHCTGVDQNGRASTSAEPVKNFEADDLRDALCGEDCVPVGGNRNEGLLDTMLTYVALPWHHIVADLLDIRREPLLTF
ncbi:hypothetical protein MTO96_030785 [Rhipicephalus appendiculatus]